MTGNTLIKEYLFCIIVSLSFRAYPAQIFPLSSPHYIIISSSVPAVSYRTLSLPESIDQSIYSTGLVQDAQKI